MHDRSGQHVHTHMFRTQPSAVLWDVWKALLCSLEDEDFCVCGLGDVQSLWKVLKTILQWWALAATSLVVSQLLLRKFFVLFLPC